MYIYLGSLLAPLLLNINSNSLSFSRIRRSGNTPPLPTFNPCESEP